MTNIVEIKEGNSFPGPAMSVNYSRGSTLKSMVFAMGWKGEVRADLEQAQTHKHQHQI